MRGSKISQRYLDTRKETKCHTQLSWALEGHSDCRDKSLNHHIVHKVHIGLAETPRFHFDSDEYFAFQVGAVLEIFRDSLESFTKPGTGTEGTEGTEGHRRGGRAPKGQKGETRFDLHNGMSPGCGGSPCLHPQLTHVRCA